MIARMLPAVAMTLLLAVPGPSASTGSSARAFLLGSFGITAQEMQLVDRGEVVARTIEAGDKREVATLGVVRVKFPPEFYVDRLADIANFKKDDAVMQIGTFGTPAVTGDVAGLTLEQKDLRSLAACRVGACDVQLSADMIERFQREVSWNTPAAHDEANGLLRRLLVEYVTRYRQVGTAAMMTYADESPTVALPEALRAMVESDTGALQPFPALGRYLLGDAAVDLPGRQELIYWSKEKMGRRPVIGLTHLVMAPVADGSAIRYVIASKNIYASHYVHASLGLTILLRDSSAAPSDTYMVYFNRSRVDLFSGLLGGIARKLVKSGARSTVADHLERMPKVLAQQYAERATR